MEQVHVIIPCYNGENYITETLNSIFNQSYTQFILTVIDDHSKDNSLSLLQGITDSRLCIIQNKEQLTITQNFNNCVRHSQTDLFCIMHQDDVYEPNYLEEMVEAMNTHKETAIAHCDFFTIDEAGSKIIDFKYELKRQLFFKETEYTFLDYMDEYKMLMMGDYIICPSVMYRRSIFESIGYFDDQYLQVEDWDFYIRILLNQNKILRVNKRLFNYRIHKKTKSQELVKNLVKYKEEISMLTKHYHTAKEKQFPLNFTEKKLYTNVFKILLWDIKNDLLQNEIILAFQKLNFALRSFPYLELKLIVLALYPISLMGKVTGNILDFLAKIILGKKQ